MDSQHQFSGMGDPATISALLDLKNLWEWLSSPFHTARNFIIVVFWSQSIFGRKKTENK
jgi:hypothetical protein